MKQTDRAEILKKQGIICLQPFYAILFQNNYNVYNCTCQDWTRYSIGDLKTRTIAETWNSNMARSIRRKMYEGKWQDICNPICPHLIEHLNSKKYIKFEELENCEYLTPAAIDEIRSGKDRLDSPPTYFNMCNSNVCNIHCIMCGRENSKDDPVMQKKLMEDLANYLPTAKLFFLTGNGDPFTRTDTLDLLINCKFPVTFEILTNGLLLPKYWDKIKHQKFAGIAVSVDAATRDTYEKIRAGGKWEGLLMSLSLIRDNGDKFKKRSISMTVMRSNYQEIGQFIDLAESYGFNAYFQGIRGNYGDENIFEPKDVKALQELRSIVTNEMRKKRNVKVFWVDLLLHLDLLTSGRSIW